MEIRTPEELEQHLAAVARGSPPPAECVLCFVERTLGACGCDGTLAGRAAGGTSACRG